MKYKTTEKNIFRSIVLIFLSLCFCGAVTAQNKDAAGSSNCNSASGLSGMYQINSESSDKLYSVIESATSKIPYGKQQQFFMDLAVRLTPPDLLAIECRGNQVFLGSSRAPRIAFKVDGVTRKTNTSDGRTIQTRIRFERDSLVFTSGGSGNDKLSFTFTPIEGGTGLKVTRQISAEELIEPVVIQTVYTKIDTVARWNIYGENRVAGRTAGVSKPLDRNTQRQPPAEPKPQNPRGGNSEADQIRQSLEQWIEATNNRDFDKQMSFYLPQLQAFYLSRNASKNSVRQEKIRVFAKASTIDIRAEQPEIIFQENGQTAVMRFRKRYRVVNQSKTSRGEVVQELRWRRTNDGWKIFSERDIRVLS